MTQLYSEPYEPTKTEYKNNLATMTNDTKANMFLLLKTSLIYFGYENL